MTKPKENYIACIEKYKKDLKQLSKKQWVISVLRLLSFLLVLIFPFAFYPDAWLGIVLPAFALVLFFFFVRRYIQNDDHKKFLKALIEINEKELKALEHDFSVFDPGIKHVNPEHANSYDLDLFGKGSLFQFVNRTVLKSGDAFLAGLFKAPPKDTGVIIESQELLKELVEDLDFRQKFSATANAFLKDEEDIEILKQWGKDTYTLRSVKLTRFYGIVLPLSSLIGLIIWINSGNYMLIQLSALIQIFLWARERNHIKRIYTAFGKQAKMLKVYSLLFQYVERKSFISAKGISLNEALVSGEKASEEIRKLGKIISAFDQRNNMFVGFLLNVTCVWDIWCSYQLVAWHRKNQRNFELWANTLATVDAMNSLANFAQNQPGYIYPKPDTAGIVKAKDLGHPLINPQKRVCNDFQLKNSDNALIITGANMSGKSTFLRTIGVNLILARCGAPVCASEMTFLPIAVFSNMRTTDSLFDDESYFFAELKRLKWILSEIEKGEKILIILDEILKGTNSVDKLNGSKEFVERLIKLNANAIIATHDLKLTEIAKVHPESVLNKCFEIEIDEDRMSFDYRLKEGVTKVMNATFLMRQMGIIQ